MNTRSRPLLMSLICLVIVACGESEPPVDTPSGSAAVAPTILPAAAVVVARVREVHPSFNYPAVVEAVQLARVRAEVSATIQKIHFSPGQLVEEGQLLIEFDSAEFEAAYDAAAAELLSANAKVEQSAANWARAEDLMPKGYISQQDYDGAKAAIDSANAAVARAEAALQKAQLDLKHAALHAPFSGKISKANYAVGDYVIAQNPTQPEPLFELAQLDPIYVISSVELSTYHRFVLLRKQLQKEGVEIPELVIELALAGGEAYPHVGEFENWDNVSAPGSGTITGRAVFPNPDGLLLPGHNVTLKGQTIAVFNRVTVPQKAVMQDQQGYFVKVIDDNNILQRVNVDLGVRDGPDWVVLQGLEEGARVVTEGAPMIRDGTEIELQ
jgi:RND family efflux transporter MFP subunit